MTTPRPSAELGKRGENMARTFLESKGYHYLEQNWHCRSGEIDLIMRDGEELVFVEVKTRHGDRAGRAEDAVSQAKARKLLATGEWYVATHQDVEDMIWRFDLVAITFDRGASPAISHYVNAIVIG